MRLRLVVAAFWLLIPVLGRADDTTGGLRTPKRQLEDFERWTEQRRAQESLKLENQRGDAERTLDRIQEDTRMRRIEQRMDELESSGGSR